MTYIGFNFMVDTYYTSHGTVTDLADADEFSTYDACYATIRNDEAHTTDEFLIIERKEAERLLRRNINLTRSL